ncbi:4Fe-4S dicluster domain-containing protein [Adlercreutzia faecimuris]|uniref:4Fe-4S dicluster domain-containing protein n=1 Tax=Adlercreutzia faecimuris TaxID=2897341 RepID=A0ABS9WF99_9ACTN|nr:4Fe-4S dicluster domain-containing protein [Adlercreutzia sp. JBNU-10]MCI2241542.1 4Fe-4S dicluster domain-containing protein [Adlercreutzia sp. JBNU-10]
MARIGTIAAVGAATLLAAVAAWEGTRPPAALLRPPGAGEPARFDARCIKCGRCLEACPYQAIHVAPLAAGVAAGTPAVDARAQACRLCPDFPCIAACPTGALAPVEGRAAAAMGTARIDEGLCLSFKGMRCEVCYRACPLIDDAITIDYRPREGDAIHAVFAPVVHEGRCAGCGLCEQRCPVSDPRPAIEVVPTGFA